MRSELPSIPKSEADMKVQVKLYVTILTTTLLLAACGGQPRERQESVADLVFTNGRVYTVDEERSWAQAVAISDGKIVYVGDDVGARELVTHNTRVVDLQGKNAATQFSRRPLPSRPGRRLFFELSRLWPRIQRSGLERD